MFISHVMMQPAISSNKFHVLCIDELLHQYLAMITLSPGLLCSWTKHYKMCESCSMYDSDGSVSVPGFGWS